MKFPKLKNNLLGSALILTIVLTSLLAIVGALFILGSQVDRISSNSVMAGQDLNSAVRTILAGLSQELVMDVPGVKASEEYYDYPGDNDEWLAALEPYDADNDPGNYDMRWSHISDVTGYLRDTDRNYGTEDIQVVYVPEYPDIVLDQQGELIDQPADADGDGVSDAKWIELEDVRSSAGEPVYAAVRVIDNGGMLNVNTGWKFNPNDSQLNRIDGSRQIQINMAALSERGSNGTLSTAADRLHDIRKGDSTADIDRYETEIIWDYNDHKRPYTPFDISDELELRNRFILNNQQMKTRIEDTSSIAQGGLGFWTKAYNWGLNVPCNNEQVSEPNEWFWRVNRSAPGSEGEDDVYDYRHISTFHNVDRIINPLGERQINLKNFAFLNNWTSDGLRIWFSDTFLPRVLSDDTDGVYTAYELAQILVNIKDYADNDSYVSMIDYGGQRRYGFEDPVIYINEVLLAIQDVSEYTSGGGPGLDPEFVYNPSLAIEFFRPFPEEGIIHNQQWRIKIEDARYYIDPQVFEERGGMYYVMLFEHSDEENRFLQDFVEYSDTPPDGALNVDPRVVINWPAGGFSDEEYKIYFGEDKTAVENGDASVEYDPTNPLKREFDPQSSGGNDELDTNTAYYWRLDYVDSSGTVLQQGQVMEFTTWDTQPVDFEGDISEIGGVDRLRNMDIVLERKVAGVPGDGWIVVDRIDEDFSQFIYEFESPPGPIDSETILQSYQRYRTANVDVDEGHRVNHLEIKRIGLQNPKSSTLGYRNEGGGTPETGSDLTPVQARHWHYKNENQRVGLNNVGEIGNVFFKSAYPDDDVPVLEWIDKDDTELSCRINLADPDVQKLFSYFTMMTPPEPNENRLKGRININTAPWYVIAQLPWISEREGGSGLTSTNKYDLAKAIVAYRDKLTQPVDYSGEFGRWNQIGSIIGPELPFLNQGDIREEKGFASIGELALVVNTDPLPPPLEYTTSIRYYATSMKSDDQRGFPDITTDGRSNTDGVANDFEERNLIFYRISDLATVRSDVFTAYILVRIGTQGPQKRYIAILDRSNVQSASDKVKIVALHSVPDPR